jgi:WD40 repeat protein
VRIRPRRLQPPRDRRHGNRPHLAPLEGDPHGTLAGHDGPVNAVCAITSARATLLATAGYDRTVRIWDPARSTCLLVIPTRDAALSVAYENGLLFAGTETGLLAIRLDPGFLNNPRT